MIRFNEEKQANEIALINIFESINGEAYAAGKPCVFIRTFGCNLRCIFCDTRECWTEKNLLKIYPERNKEADPFKWRTAKEIFNEVDTRNDGTIKIDELRRIFSLHIQHIVRTLPSQGPPQLSSNDELMPTNKSPSFCTLSIISYPR